ncbi:MAG: DUF2007 domain-containing protein [Candidatus Promineifilaceae bacterium]|nr:DUF2007 domain-containing protein [Candidatus Promineifilaceae bacterium]
MSTSASFAFSGSEDDRQENSGAAGASPGGKSGVEWKVVAETRGFLPAEMIAGRLESAGIPARAWQESVGRSFGMVIGPLGTGYVAVPAEAVEEALALLEEDESDHSEPPEEMVDE